MRLQRREFLRGLAGGLASAAALGCGVDPEWAAEDDASLARLREAEAAAAGKGPFGPLRFRGYAGLAELPWFELDSAGALRLAVEIPPATDIHTHLAITRLPFMTPDLGASPGPVQHLLECADCDLDLDVYANGNFPPDAVGGFGSLRRELLAEGLWGGGKAPTHTLPNLRAEMDRTGIARSALLPIHGGFPGSHRGTEVWLDALERSPDAGRFVAGASVHPDDPDKLAKLRTYAARGARILKLQPALQRFFPDDPAAMPIYAACRELGLPVAIHSGRAGIEPRSAMVYNLMRRTEAPLAEFPDLPFVWLHAGARDWPEAVALAKRHPNVWLGCHGQGVSALAEIVRAVGADRVLLGSDWPWYPQAMSLAKVLMVTEGDAGARDAILRANPARLLDGARA